MTRIAFFGGTFDPIHLGHLLVAQEVVEKAGVDCALFVPAAGPPHKGGKEILPAEHRLAMVKLAIEGNSRFRASEVEVSRGGVSFTIDTLKHLREELGPSHSLELVVGADQAMEFETWKDYRIIAKEFPLILTTRKGYPRRLKKDKEYLADARVVRVPDLEISGTTIRNRVRLGISIRYFVPRSVEKYIRENSLYQ